MVERASRAEPAVANGGPALRIGRIPIRHLAPQQPDRLWPAKAYVGEVVPFEATVFKEGHDEIGVRLLLTSPSGATTTHVMSATAPGTDRWAVAALVDEEGTWRWRVRAFRDDWSSWLHDARIKVPAGIDVELMLRMGADLLRRAGRSKAVLAALSAAQDATLAPEERLAPALDARLAAALEARPLASLTTGSDEIKLRVERTRAGVGSWY